MLKKLSLLLVLLASFAAPLAQAQNASTPAASAPASSTPAPASPILPLAPITHQIGQTLQNLVGVSTTAPATPAAAPAGSTTPAAAMPADTGEDTGQIADTFATGLLNSLLSEVDAVKSASVSFSDNLEGWPDFTDWLGRQKTDTRREALWSGIGSDFAIIIGLPLLAAVAMGLLLLPLRLRLLAQRPEKNGGRGMVLFGLLALRVLPLLVFLGASLLLLDQNETHKLPRFVILNSIYAIGVAYAARQILRGIFTPNSDHLRFLNLHHRQAIYGFRWFSAFTIIIIYGYFFIDVAAALRVPATSITLFQNIFGLLLAAMAIIVILQTRTRVAVILRGGKKEDTESFAQSLRNWLARKWHILTIIYLIIGVAVTWLGIDNGIALLLRGTLLTFIILVGLRFTFVAVEQWGSPKGGGTPLVHRQILSFVLRPLLWIAAGAAIAAAWGMHLSAFLATAAGQRIAGAFITVAVTLGILTLIYELLNAAIERHLSRSDKDQAPAASARARTLLPMVRHSVLILFSAIVIMTILAAIGINIGPLLAGAGVLGVAIGFGSQTLVKDFLTGLFIVVENTVAVGDVVKIGDFGGVVETISIRTIRLRDTDGTLHILPFSEVSKISNMTRGFAYALVDVGVAYDTDIEKAMNAMREIGAQLQNDPLFKRVILEPIEVMGIEKLGDSSVTLRARMRTRPGKQWDVKRLLLLRLIQRFATDNIEIPYPTVTHITKSENVRPEQPEKPAPPQSPSATPNKQA
ncbi:MAG: mechanosensitive ion channel [Alphaproteobacteria bacterium]|nr:mechanosensitive ion channel [Alphaproteobacteria bacterium]